MASHPTARAETPQPPTGALRYAGRTSMEARVRVLTVVTIPTLLLSLACGGGDEPVVPEEAFPSADPVWGSAEGPPDAVKSDLPPVNMDEGPADVECTLPDPGAWDPMLAATQTNGSAPVVVRGKFGIAETMTFNDGRELRVVRGGCTHVGETWTVSPAVGRPHVGEMRALLNRVDLRDPTDQPSLLPCLSDDKEASEDGFDCGEAYVSKSATGDLLEFSWSFAL